MVRLSVRFFGLVLLLAAILSSCQKDESANDIQAATNQAKADSIQKLNPPPAPGNYLVNQGTLKIKIKDSTYTFDASQDSVAFVNVNIDGKEYYGITAINKAHTISFGISSLGAPIAEMPGSVAGCQFLLNNKINQEYTLTHNTTAQDYGTISIEKYNQDAVLAKGTFHTYLARDDKKNSPFYVVDGSFELKVK
jgi:hypothetical protein